MPTALSERLTIVEGDGAWLTASDGRRLLDATASLWYANIGHGRRELADRAHCQMVRLEAYHTFGRFANEPALQLSDRLAELVPIPQAKIFFTSGGSDSVDMACKLARLHWQLEGKLDKKVIVSRDRAYHGLHAFGTSIGGLFHNRTGYGTVSLVPETARIPTHGLAAAIAAMDQIGPDNIAAIITEPVLGTGGVHGPEKGYLTGLEHYARANDILLILDEVITGFGRTGEMFAAQRWGVRPDLMTMAKGITSGYLPLGAVAVAEGVWSRFFDGPDAPSFRHGLTYAGHPTACVVAEANLDILEQEELVKRAAELERVLVHKLTPLEDHPQVNEIRSGSGFLAGVQLRADVDGLGVIESCLQDGVILRLLHENTIQISPPFVATDEDIDLIVDAIVRGIAKAH
ncbi:aspartate aminotransferase family protein [Mycolicibacterium litorale]|uniref:aminotransferase family protein n=1 Tax=Mycolicibacterium litorale TaxID=758802 RepID=UPI003CFA9CC1